MLATSLFRTSAALWLVGVVSARRVDSTLGRDLLFVNASGSAESAASDGFKCGVLVGEVWTMYAMMGHSLCYPKASSSWLGKTVPACSAQCQSGFTCVCPNKGENCAGASKGSLLKRVDMKLGADNPVTNEMYFAVRVKVDTKEWDYLKPTVSWSGNVRTTHFEWSKPSETGMSHISSLEMVVHQNIPGGGDFCDPVAAGKLAVDIAKHAKETDYGVRMPW